MKKKEIIDIAINQYELFWGNYIEASGSGDKEAIHQFRVSLKRFYALKRYLLNDMKPLGQVQITNYLEPLRMVYKAGGKIRDLQVIIDVADNSSPMPAPPDFTALLQTMGQLRFEKFMALSQTIRLPSKEEFGLNFRKFVDEYYKNYRGKLESFIDDNLKVASYYISSTDPGELWHDARTLIKQNYLLMQLAIVSDSNRFGADDIIYYRNMEQILGQWHDCVVLKKYALRFELTRALEYEPYLDQVSKDIFSLENSVLKLIKIR